MLAQRAVADDPSLGLMARLGVQVGGRVRKLRAVEDHSASIPKEGTSKLGGSLWKLGRRRVETFWNLRGHGLATVIPGSVPVFLPGSASADTSLLRSCSQNTKASLWRGVISRGERGILRRNSGDGFQLALGEE